MPVVWKFGGSSVGSSDNIRRIISLVHATKTNPRTIIFSALSGVTDSLLELAQCSPEHHSPLVNELIDRHSSMASSLLTGDAEKHCLADLNALFEDLQSCLATKHSNTIHLPEFSDSILSFGELLSTTLLTHSLQSAGVHAEFLDARLLIRTDETCGGARPLRPASYEAIREYFSQHPALQCTTGFIARSQSGKTTNLGRGGSDYTAALIANALDASMVEIWSDVDGVLTANPHYVSDAQLVSELSYIEAMELSHFGAKVLYPPTLQPVREKEIPLYVRNTMNPQCPGTRVSNTPLLEERLRPITAISSISSISTLILSGSGLIGIPGISKRLFGALSERGVNIVLITQASSEHSICFAVKNDQVEAAIDATNEEFHQEQVRGTINPVHYDNDCSIISVVGEGMKHQPGIAGIVFSALGDQQINVIAIAQGCSEENISFVVKGSDEILAVQTLHSQFFHDQTKVHLVIIGPGKVGSALIEQLAAHISDVSTTLRRDIQLVGIVKRNKAFLNKAGIAFHEWRKAEQQISPQHFDRPDQLATALTTLNLPRLIVADCTAADTFQDMYQTLLRHGISIVSANKHVQTGPMQSLDAIHDILQENSSVSWRFETSVGAALPIISTLSSLIATGDSIIKIESTLSGSLAFILDTMQKGDSFSTAFKQAQMEGYLEPDPREDLRGSDFKRKLLILSRLIGIRAELEDISVDPLIPNEIIQDDVPYEEFLLALPKIDRYFEERFSQNSNGESLFRYIGRVDGRKKEVSIQLEAVNKNSPFYNLSGTQNLVAFTTERYRNEPIVIMGPGAGPEVTASGVLFDIIETIQHLKTRGSN